jgi:hypothetical protein
MMQQLVMHADLVMMCTSHMRKLVQSSSSTCSSCADELVAQT